MGKATKRKKKPVADNVVTPTPEQFERGTFDRTTMAYRRVPVIDSMKEAGKLTIRQHYGLARYRDIATADERSPMRDSLDKALHGRSGEQGLPPGALRTAIELGRLEGALGSLCDIARAIAVEDVTVTQWAMRMAGARERTETVKGGATVTYMAPRCPESAKIAMVEIQMAGEWLAAAIGA